MTPKNNIEIANTQNKDYTEFLVDKQRASWKRFVDVQAPYRWNLKRLKPGFILDIGCGIGRNLINLQGQGVGIDHNLDSVKVARSRGLKVFTPQEFDNSKFSNSQQFDSLLMAHVAEHMNQNEVIELLKKYIGFLKPGGKLILITPQEAGYNSDPTHCEFMDFSKLNNITNRLGFTRVDQYSFPFPRFIGRFFTYNEFISVSCKPV
ncbi:MAG: class I SAM-dependent methyltransferase [Pleurocapsa sp.]